MMLHRCVMLLTLPCFGPSPGGIDGTGSACWICQCSQSVLVLLRIQTNLLLQDTLIAKNAVCRITPPCP